MRPHRPEIKLVRPHRPAMSLLKVLALLLLLAPAAAGRTRRVWKGLAFVAAHRRGGTSRPRRIDGVDPTSPEPSPQTRDVCRPPRVRRLPVRVRDRLSHLRHGHGRHLLRAVCARADHGRARGLRGGSRRRRGGGRGYSAESGDIEPWAVRTSESEPARRGDAAKWACQRRGVDTRCYAACQSACAASLFVPEELAIAAAFPSGAAAATALLATGLGTAAGWTKRVDLGAAADWTKAGLGTAAGWTKGVDLGAAAGWTKTGLGAAVGWTKGVGLGAAAGWTKLWGRGE